MKVIILTLAVFGFMSTAQAGVYNKGNDPKVHNMKTQECAHKQSGSLFAKTNPQKAAYKSKSRTKGQSGIR